MRISLTATLCLCLSLLVGCGKGARQKDLAIEGIGGGASTPVHVTLLFDERPESEDAGETKESAPAKQETATRGGMASTPVRFLDEIKIHVGPEKPASAGSEEET